MARDRWTLGDKAPLLAAITDICTCRQNSPATMADGVIVVSQCSPLR
jgi:hypothetical protein